MSFYQLVVRNGLGETEHVVLVDNHDASGFAYRGQTLEEGALIELDHGAIYVVVEERAEDGHRRFVCDPVDDATLENLPPVRTAMAGRKQAGFFEFWRDALPSPFPLDRRPASTFLSALRLEPPRLVDRGG